MGPFIDGNSDAEIVELRPEPPHTPAVRLIPVETSARSRALWLVGLAVSAAFAYLAVRDAAFGDVWRALSDSEPVWLAPAFALLVLYFVVRVERWRSLFEAGRRPSRRSTSISLFVGYLGNTVLPVRAGEVARIVSLRRLTNVSVVETTATAVVERIFDVLSLLLLLFVFLPWLPDLGWLRAAAILAAILALGVCVLVIVVARYGERPFTAVLRHAARLPGLRRTSIADAGQSVLAGLAGIRSPRVALVALAWTLLSWVVLGASYWLVMYSFAFELSLGAGVLVVIAVGLALILPSSPAALGVFEGATVIALGAYGVSESEGLSYALVVHALNVLPLLFLAPFVLGLYGSSARRKARPARPVPVEAPLRHPI